MKNFFKWFALIAIVAIIGFAMIACNSDAGTDSPGGGGTDGGGTDGGSTGGGSTGTGPIYGGGGGGDGGWGGGGVVGQTENGENIIVMDKETVNSNLLSIVVGKDENKTLTFKNLPAKEMPRPDDIIASGPSGNAQYGFLYKVDTVTTSDGKTVVTTTPASLEGTVKDAKVDETFPLTFEGADKAEYGEGIKLVPNPATRSVQQSSQVTSIKLEMKKEIKDTVTIEGFINLSVDVNCDIDAKSYKMERFELSAVPKLRAEVKVNIEKSLEKAWEFKIFHKKFAPITIMAGPIPIVLVPELSIDCVVSLDGKVEFEAKLLEWDYSYTFGVEYKNKALNPFQKNTSAPAKYLEEGFQISLSGEAKVKPKVKLMFGLYDCGWVGLSAGFYTSLKGEAGASIGSNASASIELSLHCGLELGAEAKLEVLCFTIAEMDTWVFWDHDWTIWKKTLVNFQALTADGNNNTGTTQLTLTFSQEIDGLSANDITLSGNDGFISKGTLSNNGRIYTLPITISNSKGGGNLNVAVVKEGYFIMPSPKKVPFYFIPVTKVTLSPKSLSLTVGQTATLTPTIEPYNATNKNVSWQTLGGNTSAVSVSDGVVTANATGTVIVQVTTSDGGKTDTCSVTVTASGGGSGTPVTGVTLNKSTLSLSVGGTEQLIATVTPNNATNNGVSWSSSNPGIATVSQNGTVTGVSVGEPATITVTTNDGNKTASCAVTVTGSGGGTGITWTAVPGGIFSGNSLTTAISYGGGKFVAGSTNGEIAYSADGINWTVAGTIFPIQTQEYNEVGTIAYGGGKFVAGNFQGKMAYSTDGINWTAVSDSKFGTLEYISSIAYGGGKFVAGGSSGKMAYSSDGVNWTAVDNPFASYPMGITIWGIVYGGDKFVVVGNEGNKMMYSTDGITWTGRTNNIFLETEAIEGAIAYGNGKFVVGARKGKMAYSTDGISWTAVTNNTFGTDDIYAVAYGGGKFVAGGLSGKMAYSTDGVNWTAATNSAIIYNILGIAYGSNRFVAVSFNEVAYSTN